MIKIRKTIYDEPDISDGKRILVMRIRPRGVSKESVHLGIRDLGTEKTLIKRWKPRGITWEEFACEYNSSRRGKERTF